MESEGFDLNNGKKIGDGFVDRSKVRILLCDTDSNTSQEVFTLLLRCCYQGMYEWILNFYTISTSSLPILLIMNGFILCEILNFYTNMFFCFAHVCVKWFYLNLLAIFVCWPQSRILGKGPWRGVFWCVCDCSVIITIKACISNIWPPFSRIILVIHCNFIL